MAFTVPFQSDLGQNNTVTDYMDITARLNDYNEITSLNQYVLNNNTIEYNKLKELHNTVSSQVLKLKQEYLQYDASISKYKLWITILNISIIAIALCLIILGISINGFGTDGSSVLKQNTAAWICVGISILYIIIVICIASKAKNRKPYSWNQYYWSNMKN